MREIRLYGSEGGAAGKTGRPYPYQDADARLRAPPEGRATRLFHAPPRDLCEYHAARPFMPQKTIFAI
jgi:hypothetical protein